MNPTRWLVATAAVAFAFPPRPAGAWAIGSQLNETGCHEPITAAALRIARQSYTTAPVLVPTRGEAALIDDVLFSPPTDFVGDVAGMTLLLGVRDNDLKGIDPLSSLDLIQVHGNPDTQEEHCIRGPDDDGAAGDEAGLTACRDFIRTTATAALDGLDATGMVDATVRTPFEVYVALAGQVRPPLPLFYVKMGAAMHALEDGFAHTYRTQRRHARDRDAQLDRPRRRRSLRPGARWPSPPRRARSLLGSRPAGRAQLSARDRRRERALVCGPGPHVDA